MLKVHCNKVNVRVVWNAADKTSVVTPIYHGLFDVYEEPVTRVIHITDGMDMFLGNRPRFRIFKTEAEATYQLLLDSRRMIAQFVMMMLTIISAIFLSRSMASVVASVVVSILWWPMWPFRPDPAVFIKEFVANSLVIHHLEDVHHLGTGRVVIRNVPTTQLHVYGSGTLCYSSNQQVDNLAMTCNVDGPGAIFLNNYNVCHLDATARNGGRIYGCRVHWSGNLSASSRGCIRGKVLRGAPIVCRTSRNGKLQIQEFAP